MTGRSEPSQETMRSALALACRAPSVHNSQPWRWKLAEHSVQLYADRSRLLPVLDPLGREMVISCGAGLHHARVAFAAEGWRPIVHRVPNPAQPDHLASIEFSRLSEVDDEAVRLAAVAVDRHTDRRPFLPDPVPPDLLESLRVFAHSAGARLVLVSDESTRREVELAIQHAGSVERARPEYRRELAEWSGTHVLAEGVPARSLPERSPYPRGMAERDFGEVAEGELPVPVLDDGAVLAVLATGGDTVSDWLGAGEALSAVLLAATREGLATCPLSQVSEVAEARDQVCRQVLGGAGVPQLVVRVGWPVTGEFPAVHTHRRPLSESVEPLFADR
ncbi:nitroreductase family protein [Saccharopolyspora erythraea NRRL 2338]|nr:nitroreductase family protein [Saccharopolyspora erythraea]PFG95519.1 nitroreductase family protein [Saccharopolyspora erythraea NRRL 2338]QRK92145.1 nitroreductase family protein [Saccharopolyspora erythraea]